MVVKIKICILRVGVCVCERLFPQKQRMIFSCIKASKNDKDNSSCAASFAGSKFQLSCPSEQLCEVVIITIINKCSLLIWKIPATFATQASRQRET